ncbi:sensor histidine kinase [Kineococcus rubinsiae]|uniref:sensor histidine kinase n=1 Tax=Kineococcus rubinsiae TaxID=2609562 RepID=UPI001431A86B|nr:ATP-binding protein [Kineococcus rubinsiae]NIZ93059.1 GHKL domain-containing protein [Kineococcus rubinsiae]
MDPRRWPFTRQALAVQALLVVLVLAVSFAGSAYLLQRQIDVEVGQRALAVARVVAEDDAVRAGVAAASAAAPAPASTLADGPVQRAASDARARTGALFVVVTDDRGLRLAHPVPARLGERVSTDPGVALGGGEEVSTAVGTLGGSARAKVPVREPGGQRVVGEVSVGIASATVAQRVREALGPFALIALAALVAGLAGAALLSRRLRRLTLGLQPEEIAGLLQGHEAVLRGIAEGVVAVDPAGRVVLANDEAARLLGRPLVAGDAVEDLPARVRALVEHPDAVPSLAVLGERALLLSSRRVSRDDRLLGSVVTVQDRTDVELLTRQLDAVQAVGTVLRAQRHEFANRLHLVSGLLGSGHVEEAGDYVRTLLATGPLGTGVAGLDAVADPYLQAFVAAKASHARENGVQLRLGEVSVTGRIADPVDVTTVLGNLVDNAVTAVRGGEGAVVEVDLVQDGTALVVAVSDSGPGVAPHVRADLFEPGVTTRAAGDGGLGLALVRQVARARGGDAWLADGGDGEGLAGAVFVARLPGAVAGGAGAGEQPWT